MTLKRCSILPRMSDQDCFEMFQNVSLILLIFKANVISEVLRIEKAQNVSILKPENS
jgi:hypothetical protein